MYPDLPNGKVGAFTTHAQAEGAIDGSAASYEVPSAYATEFAFSRFVSAPRAVPVAELLPDATASAVDSMLTEGEA